MTTIAPPSKRCQQLRRNTHVGLGLLAPHRDADAVLRSLRRHP
jgi:hypothetical protein